MKFLTILSLLIFFTGCQSVQEVKINKPKKISILDKMDKDIKVNINQNELYFSKTKNKKYYKKYHKKSEIKWAKIKIKTNSKHIKIFKILTTPIKKTNILFENANEYCIKELNALLVTPFVFDKARASRVINKPTLATEEIIAPYDEEEDEIFVSTKDKLSSNDNSMILFQWEDEKYFEVSNLYKTKTTTFRCMKNN